MIERGKYPFGKGSRRGQIAQAHEQAKTDEEDNRQQLSWKWFNSPLIGEMHNYRFQDSFESVLPKGQNIKEYIEFVLADRKEKAIGLELGGPGSAVFAGFSKGFFKRSVGVALVDQRSMFAVDPRSDDARRGHEVIEGNMFARDTIKRVDEKLKEWGEGGFDVIFERMVGGVWSIPDEPFFVGKALQTWYQRLNEGGVMFIQTPRTFDPLLEEWEKQIHATCGDTIELERGEGVFRLRKLSGAPPELPLLSPRKVREVSKREA